MKEEKLEVSLREGLNGLRDAINAENEAIDKSNEDIRKRNEKIVQENKDTYRWNEVIRPDMDPLPLRRPYKDVEEELDRWPVLNDDVIDKWTADMIKNHHIGQTYPVFREILGNTDHEGREMRSNGKWSGLTEVIDPVWRCDALMLLPRAADGDPPSLAEAERIRQHEIDHVETNQDAADTVIANAAKTATKRDGRSVFSVQELKAIRQSVFDAYVLATKVLDASPGETDYDASRSTSHGLKEFPKNLVGAEPGTRKVPEEPNVEWLP